jgi:undecaprenyl-diphosphatase
MKNYLWSRMQPMDATKMAEKSPLEPVALEPTPARPPTLLERVVAWDLALLRYLATLALPRAAALPLIALVRIGDGWIWGLVALWLWFAMPPDQLKTVVAHCLLAIGVSLALYWPVKLLIRRPRPFEAGLGVTAKVPPLDRYSFPSGHTMNNLAVSLTLAVHVPQIFAAALALPLILGGLRVLFGVHFLSDITGGALLGALSFVVAKYAFMAL